MRNAIMAQMRSGRCYRARIGLEMDVRCKEYGKKEGVRDGRM